MSISVSSQGDFSKTKNDLKDLFKMPSSSELERWGQLGVDALASVTPEDTGLTSGSWGYRIMRDNFGPVLEWYNTNIDDQGTQIAIMLQYGHGTGTGGYVQGKDYINPAIQHVFDTIVQELGK